MPDRAAPPTDDRPAAAADDRSAADDRPAAAADDGDVVGIDVGARSLHAVRLSPERRLVAADVFAAGDVDGVRAWAAGATVAAIDGPDAASPGLHRDDPLLGRKFLTARTGEVALGRHHGHWVSWVTPAEVPAGGWMAAAIALHLALRADGAEALEVYPHAAYRELAGGARLPSKQTPAGLHARVAILERELGPVPHLRMWSHDGLDAAAAALVAADRADGTAVAAGPRPGDPPGPDGAPVDDGSRIWLPRRR